MVAVSKHPRARRHVRLAKAWGGLLGFAVVALLGLRSGTPAAEVVVRALAAGLGAFLVALAGAVYAWRQLGVAEAHGEWRRLLDQSATAQADGAPDGGQPPQRDGIGGPA